MKSFQFFLEKQVFGVCSRLGEIMGISSNVIRMYFIYLSFLTLGSPLVLYLALAFWMNVRRYVRRGTQLKEFII